LNNIDKVLVVVAHPDDEVLGCGGTVARFLKEGKEVHVLILGGIATSRYKKSQNEESWKRMNIREKCMMRLQILVLFP